jgi:hypothetical protein
MTAGDDTVNKDDLYRNINNDLNVFSQDSES